MKKIRALLLVLLAAMLCALLAGCGEKDVSVSVTLVNRSGRDISSISITPSTSSDWDTEFVDGMFHDGESIESGLGTYKGNPRFPIPIIFLSTTTRIPFCMIPASMNWILQFRTVIISSSCRRRARFPSRSHTTMTLRPMNWTMSRLATPKRN